VTFSKDIEKAILDFTAIGGTTLTFLDFTGYYDLNLIRADFNSSLNFVSGITFDLHQPRNFRKWSVNNELLLTEIAKAIPDPEILILDLWEDWD
jgi:hypothetical protein